MYDFITPLHCVRQNQPLIQCITNFVTVNDCANIILAAGGSPSMSQDIREVEESVSGADALVCNLGAIDFTASMAAAGKKANQLKKPVILDPVAAGTTQLRREASRALLGQVHFSVIRGNASEIRFLSGKQSSGSGVDVGPKDAATKDNLSDVLEMTRQLAQKTDSVIVLSGALDVISDGTRNAVLHNGCPTMARITGSGCMLTALIGAFCAAAPEDLFCAAVSATAAMGVCGELAEKRRLANGTGNATFRTDLIDAMFNLTEIQLREGIHYEIF